MSLENRGLQGKGMYIVGHVWEPGGPSADSVRGRVRPDNASACGICIVGSVAAVVLVVAPAGGTVHLLQNCCRVIG